jgi:hypothetical protein
MNKILPILALAILTGCAKERPAQPTMQGLPGWSREVPQPLTPINGAVVVTNNPVQFTWAAVSDATGYTFHCRRIMASGDTTDVTSLNTTNTATSVSNFYLPSGATILWRVRSTNDYAAWPASSEWSQWSTFVRQ